MAEVEEGVKRGIPTHARTFSIQTRWAHAFVTVHCAVACTKNNKLHVWRTKAALMWDWEVFPA